MAERWGGVVVVGVKVVQVGERVGGGRRGGEGAMVSRSCFAKDGERLSA